MTTRHSRSRFGSSKGQTLVEFAVVLPFIMLVFLGVVEFGYLLLDQHVVTKLSREGSNLTSRNTSLQDAAAAMRGMGTRPVNFDASSRMILSVIKMVATTGTANYNKQVLYARYEYGALAATSKLQTAGTPSFGPAPRGITHSRCSPMAWSMRSPPECRRHARNVARRPISLRVRQRRWQRTLRNFVRPGERCLPLMRNLNCCTQQDLPPMGRPGIGAIGPNRGATRQARK
jgi:hypothetical protein